MSFPVQTRTGHIKQYTVKGLFDKFGFHAGDRVRTPKGMATVIGENSGQLYFMVDGDKGASKWQNTTKDDYATRGFTLVYSPYAEASVSYLSPDLAVLVNDPNCSDVTIETADQKLSAVKGLLCVRCPYFKRHFSSSSSSSSTSPNVVSFPNIGSSVMLKVLEFIYTGTVQFDQDTAIRTLEIGKAHLLWTELSGCE